MQSNSESSVTGPKPPPPPTHYPPYREQANVRANESRWKEIYGECVAKGAERLQLMQEPIRQPRPRSIFIDEYDTEVVNNSHSPTGKALQSRWRRAVSADTQHGYQNTPLPSEGLLRSWQNASTKGEPLTNTDVYFPPDRYSGHGRRDRDSEAGDEHRGRCRGGIARGVRRCCAGWPSSGA